MNETTPNDPTWSVADWDELTSPTDVASALGELYRRHGSERYDEAVTQLEHALQAASHAMASGAGPEIIVAALLHDVGHLLHAEQARLPGAEDLDRRHEALGADFLDRWFDHDVTTAVRLHVPAKRYLCATDPAYEADLSPASVRSLSFQGGPMDADEAACFIAVPGSTIAVELRRWDDLAKVSGAPTPPMETFEAVIADVLR